MLEAVLAYAQAHWVEWLLAGVIALLGWGYRSTIKQMEQYHARSEATAEGVKALLRDSIVHSYNKYSDRGFCPIYAKESIKKVYAAYHALGGNDLATSLYQKILKMDEDGKESNHE